MRKIAIAAAAVMLLGGCTQQQIDDDMAKAKTVLSAIKRGAAVTASAVRQGIDAACSNQQTVYGSAMATRAVLLLQTGPNSTRNIDNLDRALVSYNNACAAASSPNATNVAALLSAAISAYNSVKAAQAATGGSS